jgi:hypothetical protein
MSIYASPKTRNGILNTIFNNTDYIKINSGGGGLTIAQTDSKYLQISGVANSSAQTIFQNTVDIKSLLTVDNIKVNTLATLENISVTGNITGNVTGNITGNVTGNINGNVTGNLVSTNIQVSDLATFKNMTASGLLKSTQTTDTLSADQFRTEQLYSFNNGMVYSIISDATTVNSVKFIDIPTTINQSYIFTFILQPSTENSPYYINPSSNTVYINGTSIQLYGLQNVILPTNYTFLVQQISIIYNLYSASPQFIALTSVSGY